MEKNNDSRNVKADRLGLEMYEELFGKKPNVDPLVGLHEFTINHLFAKIWSKSRESRDTKPRITLQDRSMITVAMLAAQGRP